MPWAVSPSSQQPYFATAFSIFQSFNSPIFQSFNFSILEICSDVAAEVLTFKLYLLGTRKASGQCLSLILAIAGDGDDAAAGRHHLTIFQGCAGVEDNGVFAEQMRIVQRYDLALLIMAGVAAANQHHTDGRAVVEGNGALGKIPFGDTFEELHQVALDA